MKPRSPLCSSVALVVTSLFLWPCAARAAGAGPTDQPAAECLTASAASLKLDSLHHLRAERAELLVCAAPSCPADIRKECLRRVDEVSAAIPTILFEVKDEQGNDLSAVRVMVGGELLTERLEGIALAVDPGAHIFSFQAPQHAVMRREFVIREGEKRRREVIPLASLTSAMPGAPTSTLSASHDQSSRTAPGSPVASAEATTGSRAGAGSGSRRILGFVAAGVGITALGVGAVFGAEALSKRNEARRACPGVCADTAGVNMWMDARRAGTLSTIAFITGGVALTGAVVLWSTGGTDSPDGRLGAGTNVAVGPSTIAVTGRW